MAALTQRTAPARHGGCKDFTFVYHSRFREEKKKRKFKFARNAHEICNYTLEKMRNWGVWLVAMCLQACAMRAGAPNPPSGPGSCVSASSCSPAHAPWAYTRCLGLRGGGERARAVDASGQSEAEGMPVLQEIIYVAPKRKWQR